MFGNILNNAQILRMMQSKCISIRPFREERLKLAHYGVRAAGLMTSGPVNAKGKRELKPRHSFADDPDCVLAANEYVVIEVEEQIVLDNGIRWAFSAQAHP